MMLQESASAIAALIAGHPAPAAPPTPALSSASVAREAHEALVESIAELLRQTDDFRNGAGYAFRTPGASAGFGAEEAAHLVIGRVTEGMSVSSVLSELRIVLDSPKQDGAYIVALRGVKVESPIALQDQISVVPFSAVSSSRVGRRVRDAFRYIPGRLSFSPNEMPTAALVQRMSVERPFTSVASGTLGDCLATPVEYLDRVRLALTCLGPCSPSAAVAWFEYDAVALRDFHWLSGMVTFSEDVGHSWAVHALDAHVAEGAAVVAALETLEAGDQARVVIALRRLNVAMRRSVLEDKAVDLAVALECLLVTDAGEHSYKVSLRAARLTREPGEARLRRHAVVRGLYELRSRVVHSGRVPADVKVAGERADTGPFLHECEQVVAECLLAVLQRGKIPDWRRWDLE